MTGRILASRAASILIVVSLLLTPFSGILFLVGTSEGQGALPSEYSNGDRIIGSEYAQSSWNINTVKHMNGNLIIRAGGTVTVTNGGLVFEQSTGNDGIPGTADDVIYNLIIEDGGKLVLINSTLTVNVNQINDFPSLGVIVRNGGALEAYDSTIAFPGHLVVDDSTLTMWRSTISGLGDSAFNPQYLNSTYFPEAVYSAAPVILFMSATVNLFDSTITDFYERPAYDPEFDATSMYDHDYTFAQDSDNATGYRMAVDYYLSRMPSGVDPILDTTVDQDWNNLTMDDLRFYTIAATQTMWINGIDTAGLVFNNADAVKAVLYVQYYTDPTYTGTGAVQISYANGAAINTGVTLPRTTVDPTTGDPVQSTAHYDLPTMSSLDMYGLNVGFTSNNAGNVYIDRVWIELEFTINAYANLTLAGSTRMTSVNSYIGVDFSDDENVHNSMVLLDQSMAYIYGISVDETQPAANPSDRQPAFVAVEKDITILPSSIGTSDTTNQLIRNITAIDSVYYGIQATKNMEINAFNTSDLSGPISSAVLTVDWRTDLGFTTNNYIQWESSGVLTNTDIRPYLSTATTAQDTFDLYANGVTTLADLSGLDIQYLSGQATAGLYIDRMKIDITLSPTIYLYRWVNITATDTQGLPVKGATVDAVAEEPAEVPAFYYTPSGVQNTPASEVLNYLGKDATNYYVTDDTGAVDIPYLSEIMDSRAPNPYVGYSYNLNLTYINSTGGTYRQPVYVSFYNMTSYHGYYPDLSADSMWLTTPVTISNLILDLPELSVVSVNVPSAQLYVGDSVLPWAVIRNNGRTTALNVQVNFTGSVNGTEVVYEKTLFIPSIAYLEEVQIQAPVEWANLPYGTHTFSVYVNMDKAILEEDGAKDTNNERSVQFVVLQNLPDLEITTDSITFDPQPAYTDSPVTATVTVSNINGRAAAVGALVEIYTGSRTSGTLLASTTINVSRAGSADAILTFEPTQIGTYPLTVYVNGNRAIVEYSYDNNVAAKEINVGLNLVGPGLIVDNNDVLSLPNGLQTLKGNITVMDNGVLILDAVRLTIAQTEDNQFHIVLMGSGQLVLVNGASLMSGYKIELDAYEQSSLYLDDSSMSSQISMVLRDDAELFTESATIGSSLTADLSSTGSIVAYNTTFSGAWTLSGSTYAELTSVSIPALSMYESARVDHYRWISIQVLDGNGYPLEGATVSVNHAFTGALYEQAITGADGKVLVRGFCDQITVSQGSVYAIYDGGDYRPEAVFVSGGQTFESDPLSTDVDLQMPWYVPGQPIVREDLTVELKVSGALPQLDPPITATPSEVFRGDVVEVWTQVSNLGVVPAHNIVLMFNNSGVTYTTKVIDLLAPGEAREVYANWTAAYPIGNHVISVMVDPANLIKEFNENDNYNSTIVKVNGIAELSVTRSNVTFSPSLVSIGKTITISVNVYNSGDIPAENVIVKFYVTSPGGTEVFIGPAQDIASIMNGKVGVAKISWTPLDAGDWTVRITTEGVMEFDYSNNNITFTQKVLDYPDLAVSQVTFSPASPVPVDTLVTIEASISNIGETTANSFVVRFTLGSATGPVIDEVEVSSLAPGMTTTVTGTWRSALSPDQIYEDWMIFAVANPEHLVDEKDFSNNDANQTIGVYEVRPDLMFPTTISVTIGGSAVTGAAVGETISITTTVRNSGTSVASSALIVFYAVDSNNKTFIIGSVTKTIGSGQSVDVSYTWRVDATTGLGQSSLFVNANPNEAIIESNTSNDQVSIKFLIEAPNLSIVVNDLGKALTPGTTAYISGTVTNKNSTLGANHTLVTLYLTKDGEVATQNYTTYTDASGGFITGLYVPPTLDGTYELHVVTSVGDKVQTYTSSVQIKAVNETGVPWWIYLFILVLVGAVIIGFSAYLYKYGLGKMVECGECGALIPESSKHCPKCGVEFEAGTAKCSECNAWIPSNSTSCPECGAKFITEAIVEEEDAYLKKMREQYESYVDIFREEAKKVLGKKYSDAKFPDWWKKQPSYISFENWVSQEEQKRKTGGVACPSCGTLNPKGATTCHKCGSPIEQPKGPEAAGEKKDEEKKPLRRIVRRPVEKKAEPKAPEEKPAEEQAKPPEGNSN